MLARLSTVLTEIRSLQSQLVLLVSSPGGGKTELIRQLGINNEMKVVNVGAVLGKMLVSVPKRRRPILTSVKMREIAEWYANGDLLLLDNIELLFDQTLKLDPLDLLKQHAHSRRVVVVWPGELVGGRLIYAQMGHPEYQDYGLDGLVPFEI
ncbi:MAG: BREX-3 system P-loop-containing protein BrxF [Pseudohongiellaceae bacterium]